MFSFLKALSAEPEFLSSISISTGSPSKIMDVSSLDKGSFMLVEISTIHLDIALLSGLWALQDNKFIFISINI